MFGRRRINIVLREDRFANLKFSFIVFATLVSCRLWSFHAIPDRVYEVLEVLVSTTLLIIYLNNFYNVKHSFAQFRTNVSLFIWLPIISSIPAALFHDQSPLLSLFVLKTNFFWLLYYALHAFKIPTTKIIKLMAIVGFIWLAITVIQQITYPHYIFYKRDSEDGQQFFRAGLYRFSIDPYQFGVFFVLYFYYQYLISKRITFILYVLIGLLGFYCYATRQVAIALIICMAIASMSQEGKDKIYSTLFILLLIAILVYYRDTLFGKFINMTNDELGSNNIRISSAKFYLFEYWPNWITPLIGNGLEHDSSIYGKEMLRINSNFGYYRADIGIIGSLSYFGIFYVINVISFNIKGLRNIYYSSSNKYLKLFFINTLITLIALDYSFYHSAIPFFCFVIYLVDKSYENKIISQIENNESVTAHYV